MFSKPHPHRSHHSVFLALMLAVCLALIPTHALAAFGVTPNGTSYMVDTGGNLVFTVNSAGDLPSIKYKGTELQSAKVSGLVSGLGASSVTASTIGNTIVITCVANWGVTHYYIVQNGVDNIYIADYVAVEPANGELRWITRINENNFLNAPLFSDLRTVDHAIESTDVYASSVDGITKSKYYGNQRGRDL